MIDKEADKWKAIAILYEKTFEIYISLSSKIKNNIFPVIVEISNESMANNDTSEQVNKIQKTTGDIQEKISLTADYFGKLRLDAYETAAKLYEKSGDLQNAAEMYMESYDYCQDKSMELFDEIVKRQKLE